MYITQNKDYHVYVLLDPRKPGKYTYGNKQFEVCFLYEPYYIGFSSYTSRRNQHILESLNDNYSRNDIKENKIKKIVQEYNIAELKTYNIIIKNFNSAYSALRYEYYLIQKIGRLCNKSGVLTNIELGGCVPNTNSMYDDELIYDLHTKQTHSYIYFRKNIGISRDILKTLFSMDTRKLSGNKIDITLNRYILASNTKAINHYEQTYTFYTKNKSVTLKRWEFSEYEQLNNIKMSTFTSLTLPDRNKIHNWFKYEEDRDNWFKTHIIYNEEEQNILIGTHSELLHWFKSDTLHKSLAHIRLLFSGNSRTKFYGYRLIQSYD